MLLYPKIIQIAALKADKKQVIEQMPELEKSYVYSILRMNNFEPHSLPRFQKDIFEKVRQFGMRKP